MPRTNQEIFNVVAVHLLNQKARSVTGTFNDCMYYGSDGRCCAVGCLIPPDKYTPDFEGVPVPCTPSLITKIQRELLSAIDVEPDSRTLRLLRDLQFLHDQQDPLSWYSGLGNIAQAYSLCNDVLNIFSEENLDDVDCLLP